MRRNMRFFVALLTLTALLLTLGAAGAQDKKILYTGRQMGPDDIPTLDPSSLKTASPRSASRKTA